MKYKTLLISIAFLLFLVPSDASALTDKERLLRQIETIKREISVIQNLIRNANLRQSSAAVAHMAVDLSDRTVISEKNPDLVRPIASVTKLMSAMIATENLSSSDEITLTPEMLRPYGSSPVLFPGAKVTVDDLVKASLIQSTNDASEALTFFMERGVFVDLMNKKAKEIGMENTVFHDAHGLNPANRSTARDLTKLISYAVENHPDIFAITKNNDFWLPDPAGRMLKFYNMNNFYYLSGFIGGKTGYLPEARQTLASVFEINGRPTIIILLGSDNRQADFFSILRMISN